MIDTNNLHILLPRSLNIDIIKQWFNLLFPHFILDGKVFLDFGLAKVMSATLRGALMQELFGLRGETQEVVVRPVAPFSCTVLEDCIIGSLLVTSFLKTAFVSSSILGFLTGVLGLFCLSLMGLVTVLSSSKWRQRSAVFSVIQSTSIA